MTPVHSASTILEHSYVSDLAAFGVSSRLGTANLPPTQHSQDGVQHLVEIFAYVLGQKAQDEIAVLLQQPVFATVAAIRIRIGKMLRKWRKPARARGISS